MSDFALPKSMADLEALHTDLVTEYQVISKDLSKRNIVDENGDRMATQTYWRWRDEQLERQQELSRQIRLVKMEMRRVRIDEVQDLAGVTIDDDEGLLKGCYSLLKQLAHEGVELDEEEQAFLDLLGMRLGKK